MKRGRKRVKDLEKENHMNGGERAEALEREDCSMLYLSGSQFLGIRSRIYSLWFLSPTNESGVSY